VTNPPTPTWRESGTIMSGGDCGGDIQAGDSFARRFVHTSLPGRVVDIAAYPIMGDGTTPDPPADAPIRLQWETHTTVCRDTEDPGGTEVWSDVEYSDLPEWAEGDYHSVGYAEKAAAALIITFDPDKFIGWDGSPSISLED
jgi:hypothetical protein